MSALATFVLAPEEERRRVERVLDAGAMGPEVAAALGLPPAWPRRACHVVDAKYTPGKRCVVLYRIDGRVAVGVLESDAAARLQLHPFPDDPGLPGLRQVLQPGAAARILDACLPARPSGPERVVACRATPLRLRPARRCTLRFDLRVRQARTGRIAARTLFGKVYHDAAKAEAAYAATLAVVDAPPARAGRLLVPRAVAFVPEIPMVVSEPATGVPLRLLLHGPSPSTAPEPVLERAAQALAALHAAGPLPLAARRPAGVDLARLQARATLLAAVAPGLGLAMADLASTLAADPRRPAADADTTVLHGDCGPGQFLVAPGAVVVLDLDSCGLGDPASDVGAFTAALRQAAARARANAGRGQRPTAAPLLALRRVFLSAYEAASGCGADVLARAEWYEALALFRKSQRAFARSPRSPLSAILIAEARHCLTQHRSLP